MNDTKNMVIVAGVAWDATSDAMWQQAQALVSMPNATLYLCHVVNHQAPNAESTDIDRTMKQLQAWARERIDKDHPALERIHLEVSIGDPAVELVQSAVDHEATLLVLGTHARTGVAKLVVGSVAERVLHDAPCPVLIARPTSYAARTKTPSIAPPAEPGHKGFRPHGLRYTSSVVFAQTNATRP